MKEINSHQGGFLLTSSYIFTYFKFLIFFNDFLLLFSTLKVILFACISFRGIETFFLKAKTNKTKDKTNNKYHF